MLPAHGTIPGPAEHRAAPGLPTLMPRASRLRSMFCNRRTGKKGAGVVLLGLRGGGRLTSPMGGWKTHHCSARVAADARSPLYLG